MDKKKVMVAMSGGVDSSVAAAILLEEGYDVSGVTMDLYSIPKKLCRDENLKSCCGRGALMSANDVAHALGIPHYLVDLKKDFEQKVIKNFYEEYSAGRTPNPCIRCNQFIKFEGLMEIAEKLGSDYLATGHHARITFNKERKKYLLKKGKDRSKDQSYFLYTLTQEQLSRTLMPIGDFLKDKVRKKAEALGLPVAQRPESQEICFIPDNNYVGFLRERIPQAFKKGSIVDKTGRILGEHEGILHYTIGQRRGLGIAAAFPLYVCDIRVAENSIVVGSNDQLFKASLLASGVNWIAGERKDKAFQAKAKIRYKQNEVDASLKLFDAGKVRVLFKNPQRAITPGQAVVFYKGDTVLGGGTIESVK